MNPVSPVEENVVQKVTDVATICLPDPHVIIQTPMFVNNAECLDVTDLRFHEHETIAASVIVSR